MAVSWDAKHAKTFTHVTLRVKFLDRSNRKHHCRSNLTIIAEINKFVAFDANTTEHHR